MQILERAREVAECFLGPRAQEADQAEAPPMEQIRLLADAGLMGLTVPRRYGGLGASGEVLRSYTEVLASHCGVTTFVQGQHQSAGLLLSGCANEELKAAMLPPMARGDLYCGVAFSHLRRPGEPILRAIPDGQAFTFHGTAPWVTGYPLIREVVLGGTLPDGRLLYVAAPLRESADQAISTPMRLCAMNASGTVSVELRGMRIGPERVLKIITREEMAQNDTAAILGVLPQPFGVAVASIRLIRALNRGRHSRRLDSTAAALESALNEIRGEADVWMTRTTAPEFKSRALEIRARAIRHGVRSAHAALAASGGAGNALSHPAQRLFREAMFYTLTAQTADVQAAVLDLLAQESAPSDPFEPAAGGQSLAS